MTITGNMKFFDKNVIDGDATFTFTSATESLAEYLYDNDRDTKLISIGSDDVTDEVLLITFDEAKTFDRIYIDNHNIKSGNIKYWNGSIYTDFSSAISWSANTDTTNYYEFDSVSSLRIQITISTTIIVDAQKFIGRFIACEELGTVLRNPSNYGFVNKESSINHTNHVGGSVYIFFGQKFTSTLLFSDADDTDMALFRSLKQNATPFYVFPCGGVTTYTQEGLRLQDIYLCNYVNEFSPKFKGQVVGIGSEIEIMVHEV